MKMKPFGIASTIIAVGYLTLSATTVRAQDNPFPTPRIPGTTSSTGLGSITGRVVLPSGHPIGDRVRVTLSTLQDPGMLSYTDNNGYFTFSSLPQGNYTIEVVADSKQYDPTTEQITLLRGMRASLVLHLREKGTTVKGPSGVISLAELDPNVPGPAKKAYEKGSKLSLQGKTDEAIAAFKQAIATYPNYLIARNDLGVQYLKLKMFEEAAEQFGAAIEVNTKAFNPRLNLGIALTGLKRFSEALDHLRLAVTLDSSSPAVHLYLGITGAEVDELAEAERELKVALSMGGPEYSIANFHLANIYIKNGQRDEAIRCLRAYLADSPQGEEAVRARQLLAKIEQ